jgi:hypothetical protein
MSQASTIEQRLAQVEKELAELKQQVQGQNAKKNWIDSVTGSFKDDPEFDEILRLGKEIRDADKPADE